MEGLNNLEQVKDSKTTKHGKITTGQEPAGSKHGIAYGKTTAAKHNIRKKKAQDAEISSEKR